MKVTDEMVNRFLGWSLPKDFAPDCGISFTPPRTPHPIGYWPVGTNLFTADQARQMLEHVLEPLIAPSAASTSEPEPINHNGVPEWVDIEMLGIEDAEEDETWDLSVAAVRYLLERCAPSSASTSDAELAEGVLKLTATVRYLVGIAERGLERTIRADETAEQFVLCYVQQLERDLSNCINGAGKMMQRHARESHERCAIPDGWRITRLTQHTVETLSIESPDGYRATVSECDLNPKIVMFKLAKAILASASATRTPEGEKK